MSSQIRAYKQALADQLLGDPAFAAIPVMVKVSKEILSQIAEGTNPLGGMNVIIGGFSGRNLQPNIPGPYFDDTQLAIDIVESVTINESLGGPDCDDIAELAAALIHQEPLDGYDQAPLVMDMVDIDDPVYSIRRLMIKTPMGFLYQLPAIGAVTADVTTPGNQIVRLSCATPGAAIWYTLDRDTYPAPRNPGARLAVMQSTGALLDGNGQVVYDSNNQPVFDGQGALSYPISITAGQLLRARAWLPGYGASNPTETNIQY